MMSNANYDRYYQHRKRGHRDSRGYHDTGPACLLDDDGEIVDGCYVPSGSPIYADDGNAEIEYSSEMAPSEAADLYVDGGDWGERDRTTWVTVYTYRKGVDGDGKIRRVDRESHKVAIEAEEPECEDGGEHDWQSPYDILGGCKENPGVWGNGGGVIINEVCVKCGCGRTIDTWAQDMTDGEQGLRSVSYEVGKYAEELANRND